MRNPNHSEWKETLRSCCDGFILAAGGLVAFIAILSKQDKSLIGWPEELTAIADWLVRNNWWVVLGLAVFAALIKIVKEALERSWIWAAVQNIVDRIQTEAFAEQEGHAHHHRATLFRYQKYHWWPRPWRGRIWPWGWGRWPGSGWLVPQVRSGHATQRSTTCFLAPDDADNAEGVVGHIWARNREVALEAGTSLGPNAAEGEVSEYAGKTFVSATWAAREVSKNKVLAASFRGVPVEGKAGKKWGVLILDSRHPNAAAQATLNIDPYAYCLGKLLERV